MQRVIAISDSHGDARGLRLALEQALRLGPVHAAVFLGDGMEDWEAARSLLTEQGALCYAVRGNNDWRSCEPAEQTFSVGRVRFYACHGHQWHVKYGRDHLWYAAAERSAQVALYGHTHREEIELERGLYLVNPGAVCERSPRRSAYADIRVEENGYVRVTLPNWLA